MSLVVAWVAVHNSPSSLYFASDSRISWPDGSYWDNAQKVFASPSTNEIFAYAGDVSFPTQTLGQICQITGTGVIFPASERSEDRAQIYFHLFDSALASYPSAYLAEPFDVLYAHCQDGQFAVFRIQYSERNGLSLVKETLNNHSAPIRVLGSGGRLFENQYRREPETSYSIFHAIGKVIDAKVDKKVGGIPQVVSLYATGKTNLYGISYFGRKGLLGLDASPASSPSAVEWRNENFERWDLTANALLRGAQLQPRL